MSYNTLGIGILIFNFLPISYLWFYYIVINFGTTFYLFFTWCNFTFFFFFFFKFEIEILLWNNLSFYECEISSHRLEPRPLTPQPTWTCTCRVAIKPMELCGTFFCFFVWDFCVLSVIYIQWNKCKKEIIIIIIREKINDVRNKWCNNFFCFFVWGFLWLFF